MRSPSCIATSSPPPSRGRSALDLVEEAFRTLEVAFAPDSDRRNGILLAIGANWDADDDRWSAASMLVRHDNYPRDLVLTEALGLIVQIVGQVEGMNATLGEYPREDLASEARELRDATDRLCEIVRAVTAVHLLGERAG